MKTLTTIALLLICFAAQAQQADTVAYRTHSDSEGDYVVKYECYNEIPGDYETPHFEAVITVYEVAGNDSTQVYQPLRGFYAGGDCPCDDTERIVTKHKKLKLAEQ